jgi:hypothetical protein
MAQAADEQPCATPVSHATSTSESTGDADGELAMQE